MEIYLMQHGEAVPEEEDAERPLSPEGIGQVRRAARVLVRMGTLPGLLLSSPKKRSRQSAALIAEGLNYPYSDIVSSEALKAGAEPAAALAQLQEYRQEKSVLIAGHLPSLAKLAALLLGGEVRLRIDNGGLCRIDSAELTPGSGELVWLLPSAPLEKLSDQGQR